MSNARAAAAFERWIAKVESLGELVPDAAPSVAEEVADLMRDNIAAGRDPYGDAWKAREDGGQPLRTAAKALRVAAVGTTIFCRLAGHIARHNNGRARGGVERAIFPKRGIPRAMSDAIRRTVARAFAERLGG